MKRILFTLLISAVLLGACTVNINLPTPVLSPLPPDVQPTLPENAPQPTRMPIGTAVPQNTMVAVPPTRMPVGTAVRPSATPEAKAVVTQLAAQAVAALKNHDMPALAALQHPNAYLRISPYAYVRAEDLVFTQAQVSALWDDPSVYTWGAYDGSGLPIELNFQAYYAEFLYRVDYAAAPQMSLNQRIGMGNSMDNAAEFYPNSMIVEYHFPGFDPQYSGMDWRSLRLVFESIDGRWYLTGLINDQWTI